MNKWLLFLPLTGVQIAARLLAVALTVTDANLRIVGSSDATKKLAFEVDAQTTGKMLTLNTGAQTVDRTITVPVLGGNRTLAVIDQAQTWSALQSFPDNALVVTGSSDATKKLAFECDALTTAKTLTVDTGAQTVDRTLTVPVLGGNRTLAVIDQAQSFSGAQTIATSLDVSPTTGKTLTVKSATAPTSNIAGGAFSVGDGVTAGSNVNIGAGQVFARNVQVDYNRMNAVAGGNEFDLGVSGQFYFFDNTASAYRIRIKTTGEFVFGTLDPGGSDLMRINGGLTIKDTRMMSTKTSFSNGAAAAAGTLTNAPAIGNPTKWIPIDDNGTTRYIPAW